jgi:hypothetical protein
VRSVDLDKTDGSKPGGDIFWKEEAMWKETETRDEGQRDEFSRWLTTKFSKIARGARLTPECIEKLRIGKELAEEERALLLEMLFRREAALAWDFTEIGKVKPEVSPPVKIRTIPHEAWQTPGFPIPKALKETAIQMLKERIRRGVLESCHGPYRNPWFLVQKKPKSAGYRLVNAAMNINRVTIRDANLPPDVDSFSEEFAGLAVAFLTDFFSGYDQNELDEENRDLTGFMTPLGLLRMTTLSQRAANSVGQFVRIVTTWHTTIYRGAHPIVGWGLS